MRNAELRYFGVNVLLKSLQAFPSGKIPIRLLARLLAELPPLPPEVRLGPRIGEDACAIEVPPATLVVATDPITLTAKDIGRFSVIVNANDVAVTGARPRWFLAVVLLPPGSTEPDVHTLFEGLRDGLATAGVSLVGGHTEVTDAVTRQIVVGQMLGLIEGGRFIATSGVRSGDVVIQVGPVPIEGAAVLALEAANELGSLDRAVVRAASEALREPGISVVEPALLACDLGASSLHDPTEGGLAGGLHEMAEASGVLIRIDPQPVLWFEAGTAVCRALGADPWATLASGTLLAAFPPDREEKALKTLLVRGYAAAVIGRAEPGSGVRDVDDHPLPWPDRDEAARVLSTSAGA